MWRWPSLAATPARENHKETSVRSIWDAYEYNILNICFLRKEKKKETLWQDKLTPLSHVLISQLRDQLHVTRQNGHPKPNGDLEKVILCKQQFPAVVVALRQVLVHIVPQTLLDLFASLTPTNIEDDGKKHFISSTKLNQVKFTKS